MRFAFVFVPSIHERNPLPGYAAENPAPIWEVRSIPGNLIAVGKTKQEAVSKLEAAILWTRGQVSSFADWYRNSWSYANTGDDKIFGQVVTKQQQELKQSKKLIDDVVYDMAACAP